MSRRAIGIVTLHEDPHARMVRGLLRRDHARPCEIVPIDRIADSGVLHWSSHDRSGLRLPTVHGGPLAVADLGALWWRRAGARAVLPEAVTDPVAVDQISDDCLCALGSLVRVEFSGAWVSHPDATRLSEHKARQLEAAQRAGLRVPHTLISQDPERIRAFHAQCRGGVVVKPLTTRPNAGVSAGRMTPELLADTDSLRLSPAIYQELIEGRRHLRVQMMGSRTLSALIEAEELDWRYDLAHSRFTPYRIEPTLERALAKVLEALGLRMGIFDLKLDAQGEPVWLEVNPQGQFLFVEGLCGLPLSATLAEFLVEECDRAQPDVPGLIHYDYGGPGATTSAAFTHPAAATAAGDPTPLSASRPRAAAHAAAGSR